MHSSKTANLVFFQDLSLAEFLPHLPYSSSNSTEVNTKSIFIFCDFRIGATVNSLHSHLQNHYGSSKQKLAQDFERTLHKKVHVDYHHTFNRDERAIPASLRIKPPVRNREGYRVSQQIFSAGLR